MNAMETNLAAIAVSLVAASLIAAAAIAAAMLLAARTSLHLLQLESYQLDGYDRARKRRKGVYTGLWLCALAMLPAATVLVFNQPFPPPFFPELLMLLQAGCAALTARLTSRRRKEKKPLVFTPRMKRLSRILFFLNLGLCLLATLPGLWGQGVAFLLIFLPLLQPHLVKLAATLAQPIEKKINMGFFREAQRILRERPELIKIGITGSYGKTSTKFILAAILSEKYSVLATPSSFNTPMGLTRVIREQLTPQHEVFLAEMGARHVGDIAELCELVAPRMGILTSVGAQHLETFHSLENIAATKFELMRALPADGRAVLAEQVARDWPEHCAALGGISRLTAGRGEGADVRWSDAAVSTEGTDFTLELPGGTPVRVHTKLLGAHNIDNIALCCAAAHMLGLTAEEIARGVAKAEPVEHRLQLLRGAGGNAVIDDAFNANPAGAAAALEVLAAFPGRKVVVTPGMVELGEREAELNRAFGGQIAGAADVAILIGETRSRPIAEGLEAEGFSRENLYIVKNLDEATGVLARIARPGDVTLFENDLPDNYEG